MNKLTRKFPELTDELQELEKNIDALHDLLLKFLQRGSKTTIDERDYIILGVVSRLKNLSSGFLSLTNELNYISAATLMRSLLDSLLISTYLLKHKKWKERSVLFYKYGRLYRLNKGKITEENYEKEEVKDADLLSFCKKYINFEINEYYDEGSSFVHFSKMHLTSIDKTVTQNLRTGRKHFEINDELSSNSIPIDYWKKLIQLSNSVLSSFSEVILDPNDS